MYARQEWLASLLVPLYCSFYDTVLRLKYSIKYSQYVYRVRAKGIVGASLLGSQQSPVLVVLTLQMTYITVAGVPGLMVPNCCSTKMTLDLFLCNRTKTATVLVVEQHYEVAHCTVVYCSVLVLVCACYNSEA